MSDVQPGPGWWLASDGKWYPPQSRPQPFPPPPPNGAFGAIGAFGAHVAPRRSVSSGLGGTIQGFSWALAGLGAVAAILSLASMFAFNTYWNAPISSRAEARAFDDWLAIDDAFSAFGGLTVTAGFVLWILLMVWMNSAHKTTQQLWPGDRHWSSGWTVGAWFIPVAFLIMPKLVLSEIERIALAPRSGGVVTDSAWKSRPTLVVGKLWWAGLVVGLIANMVGNALGSDIDATLGELQAKYILNAIGLAALAAGGGCGALYVRAIGVRLSADGIRQEP